MEGITHQFRRNSSFRSKYPSCQLLKVFCVNATWFVFSQQFLECEFMEILINYFKNPLVYTVNPTFHLSTYTASKTRYKKSLMSIFLLTMLISLTILTKTKFKIHIINVDS